jgi:hypothetical protein
MCSIFYPLQMNVQKLKLGDAKRGDVTDMLSSCR